MPKAGLRTKFILISLGLLVLIFTPLTALLIRRNTTALHQSLTEAAQSFGALATQPIGQAFEVYHDSGKIKVQQAIDKYMMLDSTISNVAVYDTNGVLQFSRSDPAPAISKEQAAAFDPIYLTGQQSRTDLYIYPFIEGFGGHRYTLVYSISNAIVDQNIRSAVYSTALFGVVALAITTLILYIAINRYFLAPVRSLSQTALAISAGQLDLEVRLARKDEIADLAQSVNTMANSLKADIKKLKEVDALKSEFMMIASHNLRTPLTVISGYLEQMNRMSLSADITKLVRGMSANAGRLSTLAEDMLTISQMESGGQLSMDFSPVEVKPLLESVATDFRSLAEEKDLTFEEKLDLGDAKVNGNTSYLRHVFWNLMDNAVKFTKEGGNISVLAKAISGQLVVSVKDNGIGISAEELPKLFTKFHRGTGTLQYNYEGAGIGLYVSNLIVKQHGGDIRVESTPNQGSTFTVSLPLAEQKQVS